MILGNLPDSQMRTEAITTSDHAFVWASAGTGKTHTLALRALYLLLNAPFLPHGSGEREGFVDSDCSLYSAASRSERLRAARETIRSLVLTTFTRKAAAEMQTRLYRYLDSIAAAPSLSDLEAKYLDSGKGPQDPLFCEIVQSVLRNLTAEGSRHDLPLLEGLEFGDSYQRLRAGAQALGELATELQISTIHSLAASILRRYPLQAGIPPAAHFAREEEDDLAGVEDQVVERWWQRVVLDDSEAQEELVKLLEVAPVSQIRHWLKLSYQFPWIGEEAEALPLNDKEQIDQLVEAVQALVQALGTATGSRIERERIRLDQIGQRLASDEAGCWEQLCLFAREQRQYLFLDRAKTKGVQEAIKVLSSRHAQYFQSWIYLYSPAARICVAKQFGKTWKVWTRFLGRFISWADGAGIRELGLITFDEMIRLAVRLLEENPGIRRAEQGRLRAILVDEFQDTDPSQLRLLRALLAKDSQSQREVLGFFVGDTKQSIYRFRGADVGSIDDFYQHYQSYTGCDRSPGDFYLKTNFRSTRQVIRFVNHFFDEQLSLTAEKDNLLPIRTDQTSLPEWILIDSDTEGMDFTVDQAREYAASETLRIIQEYLDDSGVEPAPYHDVLILVRDGREVDALLPVLQRAGIPAVSSGAKTYYRHPEVLDVLNLLIALLHPDDNLAVAAVLRSPLIYLSDPDIYALLKEIPPNRLFHGRSRLPGFLPQQVEDRIQEIRGLVDRYAEETLSDWLQQVRAFIPLALYREPGDREGRPVVRIDRLLGSFQREVEIGVMAPLVWLLKQRQRAAEADRWDANLGEDINVADESVNAVRVMTVHKAKGLEERLVIVYGWASILLDLEERRGRWKSSQVIRLTTEEGRSVRAFSLDWGPLTVSSADFAEALQHELQGHRDEAKRLAYVAATRACDRLVLVCAASRGCRFPREIGGLVGDAKRAPAGRVADTGDRVCAGTLQFVHRPGSRAVVRAERSPSLKWRSEQYKECWEGRYSELLKDPVLLLERPSDPESQPLEEVFEDCHYRSGIGAEARLLAGRLVHAYLEQHLLEDRLEPHRLFRLAADISRSQPHQEAVQEAIGLLSKFYAGQLVDASGTPYPERLRSARVLGREIPVYLVEGKKAWNGVIDLVLESGDVIQAIDYKATGAKDPLPASYAQQQRIYAEALKRAFPERPVTFEFWWLHA